MKDSPWDIDNLYNDIQGLFLFTKKKLILNNDYTVNLEHQT